MVGCGRLWCEGGKDVHDTGYIAGVAGYGLHVREAVGGTGSGGCLRWVYGRGHIADDLWVGLQLDACASSIMTDSLSPHLTLPFTAPGTRQLRLQIRWVVVAGSVLRDVATVL